MRFKDTLNTTDVIYVTVSEISRKTTRFFFFLIGSLPIASGRQLLLFEAPYLTNIMKIQFALYYVYFTVSRKLWFLVISGQGPLTCVHGSLSIVSSISSSWRTLGRECWFYINGRTCANMHDFYMFFFSSVMLKLFNS